MSALWGVWRPALGLVAGVMLAGTAAAQQPAPLPSAAPLYSGLPSLAPPAAQPLPAPALPGVIVPPASGPLANPSSSAGQPPAASTPANDPAAAQPKTTPPAPSPDNRLNATWDAGGFRYRSADGSFNLHLGGRLMTDEVWWNQSPGLRLSPAQPPGSPLSQITGVGPGIGDLQDGFFVRRARFVADGTAFTNLDFKVEFDFENYNSIAFDESYIGARNLPYVGMVRFGQSHVPFGLEAYTSSRYLPMLERSPLFDAFYQEFAPGLFTNTTFLDERVTMQHMFHRIDNFQQFNGASFGDGKYAYSGRVSGLPWFEDGGRRLLHLGVAYQFRTGAVPQDFNGGTTLASTPPPDVTTNTNIGRFRARPGLRDAVGLQGDNNRVVDTGNIIIDNIQSVNGEAMWYAGPFWAQSETVLSVANNAVFPASAAGTRRGDLTYWGTYVMAGVFLTGESRGYDKPMGKYGRVVPKTNFVLTRDKYGQVRFGPGAWELLYRYSYINLNSDLVQGGTYGEHTIGLNWYWTGNIKVQFNYINGQRSVPAGAVSGNVQGFGIRGALEF